MPGKFVVITGAKGGLGTFVTQKFLAAGETVIGASRSIQWSDFANANFLAEQTDFTDDASVQKLADAAITRFGRVDVLVHVVGGFAGGTPLHETDAKTWRQMQDMNLNAAFNVIRAFVPYMRKERRGHIIAVGSHAAEQPHANLGAYVVSKTGLVTLIKTVAIENANFGITANVVLPGTMDTPANRAAMPKADAKQWVNPSEVANVIYWLASSDASQINGAAIPVSGREA